LQSIWSRCAKRTGSGFPPSQLVTHAFCSCALKAFMHFSDFSQTLAHVGATVGAAAAFFAGALAFGGGGGSSAHVEGVGAGVGAAAGSVDSEGWSSFSSSRTISRQPVRTISEATT
jgi:hypothetical protein